MQTIFFVSIRQISTGDFIYARFSIQMHINYSNYYFWYLNVTPFATNGIRNAIRQGKRQTAWAQSRIFDIFIYLLVWRFVFSPSFKRYFCDCILILFCCLPLTWNETKQQKKTPTIRENWIRDKKKTTRKKKKQNEHYFILIIEENGQLARIKALHVFGIISIAHRKWACNVVGDF